MLRLVLSIFSVGTLLAFMAVSTLAQQAPQKEKLALILELHGLLGYPAVVGEINITNSGIGSLLTNMIESDKELTEDQKAKLRPVAIAESTRIDKLAVDLSKNIDLLTELSNTSMGSPAQ